MKNHYDGEIGKLKRIASEQRRFASDATSSKILPSEKAKPWKKESLIADQFNDHDNDMKQTRNQYKDAMDRGFFSVPTVFHK
jgi:hypothetical protein